MNIKTVDYLTIANEESFTENIHYVVKKGVRITGCYFSKGDHLRITIWHENIKVIVDYCMFDKYTIGDLPYLQITTRFLSTIKRHRFKSKRKKLKLKNILTKEIVM